LLECPPTRQRCIRVPDAALFCLVNSRLIASEPCYGFTVTDVLAELPL
jgi:hypothetical protein